MVKSKFSHHSKFVTQKELLHGDESIDLHQCHWFHLRNWIWTVSSFTSASSWCGNLEVLQPCQTRHCEHWFCSMTTFCRLCSTADFQQKHKSGKELQASILHHPIEFSSNIYVSTPTKMKQQWSSANLSSCQCAHSCNKSTVSLM